MLNVYVSTLAYTREISRSTLTKTRLPQRVRSEGMPRKWAEIAACTLQYRLAKASKTGSHDRETRCFRGECGPSEPCEGTKEAPAGWSDSEPLDGQLGDKLAISQAVVFHLGRRHPHFPLLPSQPDKCLSDHTPRARLWQVIIQAV